MTNHTCNTIGVDISKNHLDAHQLPSGRTARFANDAAGFKELAAVPVAVAGACVHRRSG